MMFRIAVLGATGYIGSPYRREIRECPEEAIIVSLCGRRRDLLQAAAQEDNAELITDDWQEAIAHPGINLVLVCTPDALHHSAVMACAQCNLHVVCEKPLGLNATEAMQMWNAYRDRGLGHFVPLWTRYVDVFRKAKEVYDARELGQIQAFVYRWHNPRPAAMPFTWRDDTSISAAGSIADVGSHAYDALRWILGDEAKRVLAHADVITPAKPDLGEINLGEAIAWGSQRAAASGVQLRKGTAWDYASIAIEMCSGVVGTIVLSHAPFLRKGVAPELELHGTEGSLSIDRITGAVRLFRSGVDGETIASFPEKPHNNRFRQFAFPGLRDRIARQPSDHPGLDDGYRIQLFTDAAARSAHLGAWVGLSDVEDQLAQRTGDSIEPASKST